MTPDELWDKLEKAQLEEDRLRAEQTPEYFAEKDAELNSQRDLRFLEDLHDLLRKWYPDRESWSTPLPNFWYHYSEAYDAILMSMVCPVVCRGYLDGDSNWHQLCLDKVKAMKEA